MYTLHYVPDWASLAVRLTLEEFDIPYKAALIDNDSNERDSAAFRKMSPLGLVPAFSTPDGDMCETLAILLWLGDRHEGVSPVPSSQERAAYLKWLLFINNSIHNNILSLFHPERVSSASCANETMQNARAQIQVALGIVDSMLMNSEPSWMNAEKPTALNYYLGLLMRWMNGFEATHPAHISSRDYPSLHTLLQKLEKRPAACKCAELEGLGETIFTNPTLV
ncbi:glutathione S-transferase family protein [Pseudomonas sp. B21-056]|jgi:glutathione S-transferase|uniref:glutathione S-transferase family protein n=1 Tax=Pseudomonas sp. B21-056 TaxID=2895495 RepID=UPI00223072DF|nr:glutathione S-transferase family protein [Pseudomonas sp. B21-056]UZE25928.1 glutathione S-transferase family protein [Pseudomonas sp. B21-056]